MTAGELHRQLRPVRRQRVRRVPRQGEPAQPSRIRYHAGRRHGEFGYDRPAIW